MYNFVGKKGSCYELVPEEVVVKLNSNCPADEKTGEGEGSCGGGKGEKAAAKSGSKKATPAAKSAPAAKTAVPTVKSETQMDVKDIVNRVKTGGKITKEEHAYLSAILNGEKPKAPAASPASTPTPVPVAKPVAKTAPKPSEKKVTPAKKPTEKTEAKPATKKEVVPKKTPVVTVPEGPKTNVSTLLDNTEKVWSKLNQSQKDTMEEFTSTVYVPVNTFLRTGEVENYGKDNALDKKEIQAKISELDKIFKNVELDEPATVFRGLGEETFALMKNDLVEGAEFSMTGFTSTSHDQKVVDTFARGKHTATMEIRLPKGAKALALENHSNFKAEKEVLLNRDTKFRVVSTKTKKIHGGAFSKTHIILEVI